MAQLIKADGTESTVQPANGRKWTLNELQTMVGGYIELMPGVAPVRLIMDEDGRLKHKPVNQKATALVARQLSGKALRYLPVIVGDVVVLEKGERW